jgi:predicted deacylase
MAAAGLLTGFAAGLFWRLSNVLRCKRKALFHLISRIVGRLHSCYNHLMEIMEIAGCHIAPGERRRISINVAPLYDFTPSGIPVEVIRGKKPGPVLFISAALHGDEINGVDIIRRLLNHKRLKNLKGTLMAVPIVNVFGFNTKSRYLPDRRDLNRCFPGEKDGSLAGQVACTFMEEIVSRATHGIDLHTGAIHRSNLPQIRACLDDDETRRLAEAFGVPVIINSDLRDGSLREAARNHGIPTLLYEAGEALRFDDKASKIGLRGILNVMEAIGMLEKEDKPAGKSPAFYARGSYWVRAPYSGIMQVKKHLGDRVVKGQLLAVITDPFGAHKFEITAKTDGIIIGMSMLPLFNKGDAVFHIATFENSKQVEEHIDNQAETFVL